MRVVLALAIIAAGLLSGTAAADGRTPYLATIAIERVPGAGGALGEHVLATLHVRDLQAAVRSLARVDGLDVLGNGERTVRVRFGARPTLSDSPGERLRQSSWVVDYDDRAVQALLDPLLQNDAPPTPAALERLVFEHVTNKSYSRAFDLASRVAATREGDCTEHAVLLAAMARASGYSARVVFGNLVLEQDDELSAFGHAWVEIHDGDRWQIRDATMPEAPPNSLRALYLPLGTLADEGPAYALSLMETMNAMPVKITDVAASEAP